MAGLDISPDQIAKARQSGYSDAEIVEHLATKAPEQFKAAVDAGYSPKEILSHFSDQPVTAAGTAKAAGQGLREGTETLAGLPGDVGSMGGSILDKAESWLVNKITGIDPKKYQEASAKEKGISSMLPTSEAINSVTSKVLPNYEPKNQTEKVTRNVLSFLPASLGGPESILANVAKRGVVPGVVSEVAGETAAKVDPRAEMPARVLGSLASLGARRQASTVPTDDILRAEGGAGAQAVRDMPLYTKGAATDRFVNNTLSEMDRRNMTPNIAPETTRILQDYRGRIDTSAKELDELKLRLNGVQGGLDKTAATAAKRALDDHIDSLVPHDMLHGDPAQMAALWNESKANYAAGMRGREVEDAIDTALGTASKNNSGLNVGNDIRNSLNRLTKDRNTEAIKSGFNPAEIAALRRITRGTIGSNLLRYGSNVLGGGGGIGSLVAGGIIGGAGASEGGPEGGIAGPLAMLTGLGLRKGYNRVQVNRARALSEMTRARSPLAQLTATAQPVDTTAILRLLQAHNALVNTR